MGCSQSRSIQTVAPPNKRFELDNDYNKYVVSKTKNNGKKLLSDPPSVNTASTIGTTDSSSNAQNNKHNNKRKIRRTYSAPSVDIPVNIGKENEMKKSNSIIGLDILIEARKAEGNLKSNVVRFEMLHGMPIEDVYSGVHNGTVLGSGTSGEVRLVTHKLTGVQYAVKCLDLAMITTEEKKKQLREEIMIMCQLDHPNIVRLEGVYESHNKIYMVQELCTGGELFDRLDQQPNFRYTEQECSRLVRDILGAVRYIHGQGIIHRDLKLENFLFRTNSSGSELKLIDFGISKFFTHGEYRNESGGTPYTVAPEVIRRKYDEKCDIWAVGVITYLLLSGSTPFGGCSGERMLTVRDNILSGSFTFEPKSIWCNVSEEGKRFISSLLVTDPVKRPTAAQAQYSSWIVEWAEKEGCKCNGNGKLDRNVFEALVDYKGYDDTRKLLCRVLSLTMLPEQVENLKDAFEKVDYDRSGEISLDDLRSVLLHHHNELDSDSDRGLVVSDEDVKDIFHAMKTSEYESTVKFHEFVAAGLSMCNVDERNLKIAFERLDKDHKGHISCNDLSDLMGIQHGAKETLRDTYQRMKKNSQFNHTGISYADLLSLSKEYLKSKGLQQIQREENNELVIHEPEEAQVTTKRNVGGSVPAVSLSTYIDNLDYEDGPLTMDDD